MLWPRRPPAHLGRVERTRGFDLRPDMSARVAAVVVNRLPEGVAAGYVHYSSRLSTERTEAIWHLGRGKLTSAVCANRHISWKIVRLCDSLAKSHKYKHEARTLRQRKERVLSDSLHSGRERTHWNSSADPSRIRGSWTPSREKRSSIPFRRADRRSRPGQGRCTCVRRGGYR